MTRKAGSLESGGFRNAAGTEMPVGNALEDLTADGLDPRYVKARVEDWALRIAALYDRIEGWLPKGWSASRKRTMWMEEDLMRELGIPGRDLPILDIRRRSIPVASIRPLALWVVGTNGRLDLRGPKGLYLLIDRADMGKRRKWEIVPAADRANPRALGEAAFLSAIA